MFGKRMRFVTMVGIAAGIPYAWFNENFASALKGGLKSFSNLRSSSPRTGSGETWPVSFGLSSAAFSERDPNAPPSTPTLHRFDEVLRFDVTPRWVTQQWDRISSVRAERDLVGMRVPLVTGTSAGDFAGSLTYYFDARQRLRRLTLHGHTGDDQPLVQLATKTFGLRAEPHLGAGIYLLRWNAKPMTVLRVSHAPVIRSDEPFTKFIIEMEINDVYAGYGLTPEFAQILVPDQHVRRW